MFHQLRRWIKGFQKLQSVRSKPKFTKLLKEYFTFSQIILNFHFSIFANWKYAWCYEYLILHNRSSHFIAIIESETHKYFPHLLFFCMKIFGKLLFKLMTKSALHFYKSKILKIISLRGFATQDSWSFLTSIIANSFPLYLGTI